MPAAIVTSRAAQSGPGRRAATGEAAGPALAWDDAEELTCCCSRKAAPSGPDAGAGSGAGEAARVTVGSAGNGTQPIPASSTSGHTLRSRVV